VCEIFPARTNGIDNPVPQINYAASSDRGCAAHPVPPQSSCLSRYGRILSRFCSACVTLDRDHNMSLLVFNTAISSHSSLHQRTHLKSSSNSVQNWF
jgi:hypothetical protein